MSTVKKMPWIDHRAMALRIYTRHHDLTVIAAYAPGETATLMFKNSNWNVIGGHGFVVA